MRGFKTKNSTYYIDINQRLIWGGKLGNKPHRYAMGAQCMIGGNGLFYFVDENDNLKRDKYGQPCYIRTGIIEEYI